MSDISYEIGTSEPNQGEEQSLRAQAILGALGVTSRAFRGAVEFVSSEGFGEPDYSDGKLRKIIDAGFNRRDADEVLADRSDYLRRFHERIIGLS